MSSKTTTCAAFPSSLFSCSAVTEQDTSVATSGVVDCSTNEQLGCILRQTFRKAITCKNSYTLYVVTIYLLQYTVLLFVSTLLSSIQSKICRLRRKVPCLCFCPFVQLIARPTRYDLFVRSWIWEKRK